MTTISELRLSKTFSAEPIANRYLTHVTPKKSAIESPICMVSERKLKFAMADITESRIFSNAIIITIIFPTRNRLLCLT